MAENRPDRSQIPGPDYGVALTPAVYFVNFLFMYFSNPHNAANMPAYRAPIPPQLATCLLDNPEGCRYADYQQYFNGQDVCRDGHGGDKCRWKSQCEVAPSSQHLAPPEFRNPDQINKPLGITHATKLARQLGIDEEIVLTPEEYECLIGTPGQRSPDQDTIDECIHDLTNSNGVADIPLGLDPVIGWSYAITLRFTSPCFVRSKAWFSSERGRRRVARSLSWYLPSMKRSRSRGTRARLRSPAGLSLQNEVRVAISRPRRAG